MLPEIAPATPNSNHITAGTNPSAFLSVYNLVEFDYKAGKADRIYHPLRGSGSVVGSAHKLKSFITGTIGNPRQTSLNSGRGISDPSGDIPRKLPMQPATERGCAPLESNRRRHRPRLSVTGAEIVGLADNETVGCPVWRRRTALDVRGSPASFSASLRSVLLPLLGSAGRTMSDGHANPAPASIMGRLRIFAQPLALRSQPRTIFQLLGRCRREVGRN